MDLNYVSADLENGPSGDGFGTRGSVGFGGNFFVFAELLDGDEFALNIAGRYYFTENFAAAAEYEIGDDAQNFIVGIRFTF